MPLDEMATKRAVLWSTSALVAIAALSLGLMGWDDALWVLSLAPVVWPIAVWYRRKKSIDILKRTFWQSPETHDEDEFPVLLAVNRGMWFVGQDIGLLRFDNHRMIFEGLRSRFNLHRQDVESGADNDWVIFSDPKTPTDVSFTTGLLKQPGKSDHRHRLRQFQRIQKDFLRSGKSREGDSTFPPSTPQARLEVRQPILLIGLCFATSRIVILPLWLAEVPWKNHLAVTEIPWILSLIGLWLFLNSAKQKASARFGSHPT